MYLFGIGEASSLTLLQCTCMIFVYFRNCAVLEPLANDQEFAFSNAWLKMIFFKPLKNKIIGITLKIYESVFLRTSSKFCYNLDL